MANRLTAAAKRAFLSDAGLLVVILLIGGMGAALLVAADGDKLVFGSPDRSVLATEAPPGQP
jgi:hypothetical protein